MTAQLAPLPVQKFFDNNGAPLFNGLLYTFAAGTTTAQATYVDSTQTTQNPNPVVLNARGECSLWLDPTKNYKLQLTDSGNNQIWAVDNVPGGINFTQQTLGQILYPQIADEIAALVTPVNYSYQPFDVRRYGADPTGGLPSDAALANAIAVCGINGGTIRFPNGVYSFANPINLNSKIALIFQGDGSADGGAAPGTQLLYTGAGSSAWITMAAASGCWFRDMQLYSNNASFTGPYITCGAISSQPANFCGLKNVVIGDTVGGGNVHLNLDQTIAFTADGCNFIGGNPSVLGAAAGSYSNNIRFRDCHWVLSFSASVQPGGQAWLFSGCTFEALSGGAPGALVSPVGTQIIGFVVEACWFGDPTAAVGTWLDIRGQNMSFIGNYISGNQTGSTGITLEGFHGAVIQGNTFAGLLNGINCASAVCDQTVLSGNVFNSVTNPVAGSAANSTPGTWTFGSNFGLGMPAGHGLTAQSGFIAEGNGLIRQWGRATGLSNGANTITFPKAFPNNCFNVVTVMETTVTTTATVFSKTLTTANYVAQVVDAGATVDTAYWQAIGN
jgi:Pectate lyase superfamily protein